MALTPSNMIPLGTKAPDFRLMDTVTDTVVSLDELRSDKATVIMFICNHCPYVKHIREELVKIYADYEPKGVSFIAISSNDVESYPEDSPEMMKKEVLQYGYKFPYLFDETQAVARAYDAACTPDFYLFNANMELVYRGRLDDSRPGNDVPLTGNDLREAIDNVLQDNPVPQEQLPSMGCNIKWKENED